MIPERLSKYERVIREYHQGMSLFHNVIQASRYSRFHQISSFRPQSSSSSPSGPLMELAALRA